jgi:uroporphyrinogen decarboxylase
MTPRERYINTILFRNSDKPPFSPGGGRRSTLEAWRRQGLPADVTDYHAYIREMLGIPTERTQEPVYHGVDFRMMPIFEEKVLEYRPAPTGSSGSGTVVVQDWKGNICEISDEFDVSYLRNAIDFVTRSWIKCPVESRTDWEEMKTRYVVDAPGRFPEDFIERAKKLKDRDYVAGIGLSGPFWQLREWLGFENLCMLFLDDPQFVHDMVDFWEEFVAQLFERMFEHFVPDVITINEDMAYKIKPMIGPDMCREFLVPCWRRWGEIARKAGVTVYEIDSDGYVGDLIPVWLESGLTMNSPQEVAAGNDIMAYRKEYGHSMAFAGGVDKRAMAAGGDVIRAEIDRIRPVIEGGGFIPSCDHGVPADVSWPNYVEYCRLLAQATGWIS